MQGQDAAFGMLKADPGDTIKIVFKRWEEFALRWLGSHDYPEAFLDFIPHIKKELFWPLLHRAWPNFDRIPHDDFSWAFDEHIPYWRAKALPRRDYAFFKNLPDKVTAYRGQSIKAPHQLSWTIDRRVAAKFAYRASSPAIITAEIPIGRVVGAYASRNEAEVLIFSPDDAVVVERQEISKSGIAEILEEIVK